MELQYIWLSLIVLSLAGILTLAVMWTIKLIKNIPELEKADEIEDLHNYFLHFFNLHR